MQYLRLPPCKVLNISEVEIIWRSISPHVIVNCRHSVNKTRMFSLFVKRNGQCISKYVYFSKDQRSLLLLYVMTYLQSIQYRCKNGCWEKSQALRSKTEKHNCTLNTGKNKVTHDSDTAEKKKKKKPALICLL